MTASFGVTEIQPGDTPETICTDNIKSLAMVYARWLGILGRSVQEVIEEANEDDEEEDDPAAEQHRLVTLEQLGHVGGILEDVAARLLGTV